MAQRRRITKKDRDKTVSLRVTGVLLESERAKETPRSAAYAFSSGGRLLAHERLDAKGVATLSLPVAEEAQSVRILVGPRLETGEIRVSELLRRGAEERLVRLDPGELQSAVEIVVIPDKWLCWLLSLCFVRGTLVKRVISGGIPIDLPVCGATVEVYEVDPVWIIVPKLPDLDIERIRDFILKPPPPPPPPPLDDLLPPNPPLGPLPQPPEARPLGRFSSEFAAGRSTSLQGMAALSESGQAMAPAPSGVSDLQFLARNTNTAQFRQVLLDHPTLVQPILCFLFPPVSIKLVATATTDECGRFQTFFFRGCNNPDIPDLYFKAKQKIFPFLPPLTIYAPTPIPCFTHWNYKCGSEVTLRTMHPLAITCLPCPPVNAPPDWVLVMAIGNRPLSLIRGTSVPLQATTTPANMGLTLGKNEAESPAPGNGAPFGGLLRLRLEFDNSLRQDLGVKYYRVSYRKGTSGNFIPLTGTVIRHYTVAIAGDLVLKVFNLGPQVVNGTPNLFEIPPALPPEGQWTLPDVVENTTSAKFPTLDLAPGFDPTAAANRGLAWPEHGKYQLKVDLFDTSGALVNIDSVAGKTISYRVPAVTDLSGDIDTEDAASLALVFDDNGDGKKSFIMTVHVDNSSCKAEIDTPTLDGTPASPDCGVLEYDPTSPGSVSMPYTPRYPTGIGSEGFATYQFRVKRGATQLSLPGLPDTGDTPLPSAPITNTQTTSDLLGDCTVAGFAEILNVWAKATNGWRRLQEYDSHDVRAFVLAPKPEE